MKFRLLLLIVLFLSKNGFAQNKPQLFSQSVKEDLDYLLQIFAINSLQPFCLSK